MGGKCGAQRQHVLFFADRSGKLKQGVVEIQLFGKGKILVVDSGKKKCKLKQALRFVARESTLGKRSCSSNHQAHNTASVFVKKNLVLT